MTFVEVAGRRLEIARWGGGPVDLVLLHDGLGSITQWRDLPELLAASGDVSVVAYDRAGHGRSTPVPDGPWPIDWMSTEATVLGQLLGELGVARPVLVGHSDGGSIALLAAACGIVDAARVVTLAAHSYVEPCCVEAIAALRADPTELVERLGRHHDRPAAVFEAWSGAWTDPEFARWDIRPSLAALTAPTLVLQGTVDEYGTDAMLWDTVAAVGPNAQGRLIDGAGHLLHRDVPEEVAAEILDLLA